MKLSDYKRLFSERPCGDAIKWLETQPDMVTAWENCKRSDWMWWALRRMDGKTPTKEQSILFAQMCAKRAKKFAAAAADAAADATADAAADDAATYADTKLDFDMLADQAVEMIMN
jgi:hypothetical protein